MEGRTERAEVLGISRNNCVTSSGLLYYPAADDEQQQQALSLQGKKQCNNPLYIVYPATIHQKSGAVYIFFS